MLERSFVAQLNCAILWKDILEINTVNLKVSIKATHETLLNNGFEGGKEINIYLAKRFHINFGCNKPL